MIDPLLVSGVVGKYEGPVVFYDESADVDMDTCRNCGHFKFLHDMEGTYHDEHRNFTQTCDPQQDHACKCSEYVPEDNLEYCVWLDAKRRKGT